MTFFPVLRGPTLCLSNARLAIRQRYGAGVLATGFKVDIFIL